MKKKLISILTIVCMMLAVLPTAAFAADVLEGSCGDDISWVLDTSAGTLTVSGTGAMKDYNYFADVPWAKNRTSIKKIVVNPGVTHIGTCAFNMWAVSGQQLTTVELPDTVTSIGKGAFTACEKLVSCNLPDSITSIGGYAFSYCASLRSTKLPASLTSMGDEVFMDCTGLGDTLEFPAGLTEIPEEAYSGCTGIKRVTLHDGITSIGNSAFEETSIQKIVIPSSVNTVGSGAFRSCKSLRFVDMKGGTAICRFVNDVLHT